MADAILQFVALPDERYWDQHGLQRDFRFQCTPDPCSDRFRRRAVIHNELQMLLLEHKPKTSNNVLGSRDEKCSNFSM